MASHLVSLLSEAMARKRWREANLVRESGVTQSRINRLLRGATKDPEPDLFRELARALHLPVETLVEAHAEDIRVATLTRVLGAPEVALPPASFPVGALPGPGAARSDTARAGGGPAGAGGDHDPRLATWEAGLSPDLRAALRAFQRAVLAEVKAELADFAEGRNAAFEARKSSPAGSEVPTPEAASNESAITHRDITGRYLLSFGGARRHRSHYSRQLPARAVIHRASSALNRPRPRPPIRGT